MWCSSIQFNAATFRGLFIAFADQASYPDAALQVCWNAATDYISVYPQGYNGLKKGQQTLALNQLTAHIAQVNMLAATGQAGGVITASSVDKISITLMPPPATNEWRYWLNQTPYGQQLLALLEVAAVGGTIAAAACPFRLR